MLLFYRLAAGVLKLRLCGEYAERAINLCAENGVTLWGISRQGDAIYCFTGISDFRRLPHLLKHCGVRVHILKKLGLPFLLRRYRYRAGIAAGATVFFGFLLIMSRFVWVIDVKGNSSVSSDEILSECEKLGITVGMPASELEPREKRQQLLLELDSLSWAALNLEGCRLTVDVKEAKKSKEDTTVPVDLKAACDGIITGLDIKAGTSLVKIGDTVRRGDILVSGAVTGAGKSEFVHSLGTVYAKTERQIELKEPFETELKMKIGKVEKCTVAEIFSLKIPLYLGDPTRNSEGKLLKNELSLFGKSLPLAFYTYQFEKFEKTRVKRTAADVAQLLDKRLDEYLTVENLKDFEVKNREYDEKSNEISLKVSICGIENIAVQSPMLFNVGN